MSESTTHPSSSAKTEDQALRCPQCHAQMSFDAQKGMLLCTHCGAEKVVHKEEDSSSIVEHDLISGLDKVERGLGVIVKTARCNDCGASISFGEQMVTNRCDFCGSMQILEQESNRNLIRPESVVPFSVDQSSATQKFRHWISKLWFRPSDLKKLATLTDIAGVYIPYWTFDTHVDSSWSADAGYYYYEEEEYEDSEGEIQTRSVQHTRWESAWGSRSDDYDDILICASKGVPDHLAERLRSFNTTQLKPYSPEFLAGWKAEEYAVELQDAWNQAMSHIESGQYSRCGFDVPGDTHRDLSVENHYSSETFKHVLLPIWISAYRYKDRVFRFLVNGQTGEIVGKAPYSALKITLFIFSIVSIIASLVYFFNR